VLTTYLGGVSIAGGPMKETGTAHWLSPNIGATDSSGFTALPGGQRDFMGSFGSLKSNALFWSSSQSDATNAWNRILYSGNVLVGRYGDDKAFGFSARCIRN